MEGKKSHIPGWRLLSLLHAEDTLKTRAMKWQVLDKPLVIGHINVAVGRDFERRSIQSIAMQNTPNKLLPAIAFLAYLNQSKRADRFASLLIRLDELHNLIR